MERLNGASDLFKGGSGGRGRRTEEGGRQRLCRPILTRVRRRYNAAPCAHEGACPRTECRALGVPAAHPTATATATADQSAANVSRASATVVWWQVAVRRCRRHRSRALARRPVRQNSHDFSGSRLLTADAKRSAELLVARSNPSAIAPNGIQAAGRTRHHSLNGANSILLGRGHPYGGGEGGCRQLH